MWRHGAATTVRGPSRKDVALMKRLLPRTQSPFGSLTVRDAMHRGIVTCDPSADVRGFVPALGEHDVAHLIVQQDGHPVGVLSTLDIARAVSRPTNPETKVPQ